MATLILNFDEPETLKKPYEKELRKAISHRLLSEIGYGRMHNLDTLEKIKEKYNLEYEKIIFFDKEKKYKINFSKKQKKHGKIIDVEKEKKREEYDLFVCLKNIERNGEKILENGIDLEKKSLKLDELKTERMFLSEGFKLGTEHIIVDMLMTEFVAEQKKKIPYNKEFLEKLKEQGYVWENKIIDLLTFKTYGSFISKDYLSTISINKDKTKFLIEYAKEMIKFWVRIWVEQDKNVKINICFE